MSLFIGKTKYKLVRFSGILVLLGLWELLPGIGLIDPQILPRFSKVISAMMQMFLNEELFMHAAVSLWRILIGLSISAALAIPTGFILGKWFPRAIPYLNPLFRVFGQVNPFSIMPVFILFFGIGETAKLVIVAWVCIWPIVFNSITGVQTVDATLVKAAESLNIKPRELIGKVLFPGAAPSIFLGLRVAVEMAFFMLMAGEMLGASAGLGYVLHNAGHFFIAPKLYAAGLCIVLMGVALNRFLKFMERGSFFWRESLSVTEKLSGVKSTVRIGKPELAIIALILAGLVLVGTQQVQKANLEGTDPIHHMHAVEKTGE